MIPLGGELHSGSVQCDRDYIHGGHDGGGRCNLRTVECSGGRGLQVIKGR